MSLWSALVVTIHATILNLCTGRRFAARHAGLASGMARAVRPAGLAEAPALKGGS